MTESTVRQLREFLSEIEDQEITVAELRQKLLNVQDQNVSDHQLIADLVNAQDQFNPMSVVRVVADTVEGIRACDVDRMIEAAANTGHLNKFLFWLEHQQVRERVRIEINQVIEERNDEQANQQTNSA